jgi:hypothetical protein
MSVQQEGRNISFMHRQVAVNIEPSVDDSPMQYTTAIAKSIPIGLKTIDTAIFLG